MLDAMRKLRASQVKATSTCDSRLWGLAQNCAAEAELARHESTNSLQAARDLCKSLMETAALDCNNTLLQKDSEITKLDIYVTAQVGDGASRGS